LLNHCLDAHNFRLGAVLTVQKRRKWLGWINGFWNHGLGWIWVCL